MTNVENYTENQLMALWYEEELKERMVVNPGLREYIPEYHQELSQSPMDRHGSEYGSVILAPAEGML